MPSVSVIATVLTESLPARPYFDKSEQDSSTTVPEMELAVEKRFCIRLSLYALVSCVPDMV